MDISFLNSQIYQNFSQEYLSALRQAHSLLHFHILRIHLTCIKHTKKYIYVIEQLRMAADRTQDERKISPGQFCFREIFDYSKGKYTIRLESTTKYQQLGLISKTLSRAVEFHCSCSVLLPCTVTSLFRLHCIHSADKALNINGQIYAFIKNTDEKFKILLGIFIKQCMLLVS